MEFNQSTEDAISLALKKQFNPAPEGEGIVVEKQVTTGSEQGNVQEVIKAALTTNPATTGDVLISDVYDEGIREFVETASPVYNILPKQNWRDGVYRYRETNGLPTAAVYAEMAALPTPSHSTWAESFAVMKNIWVHGEISGQEIASANVIPDVYAREIRNSALAIIQKIEDMTIVGDESGNANEFSGLLKQITTYLYEDSLGTGLGTAAPLTLALLDLLIDSPVGDSPNVLIMNRAMRRKINSLMQAQVRYVVANDITLSGGVNIPTFNGVPMVTTRGSIAALNDKIIAVSRDFVGYKIQKPIGVSQVAKLADSERFFVNTYMTFVVEGAARYHAVMAGLSTAIA
jgi:HK97 family phage major capsid protein